MEKRILGQSGIEASRLGFGCLGMSYLQQGYSARDGGRLIIHALESGIDFVDTAQFYATYSHLAYVHDAGFKDFTLCTKSYAYDEATAEAALTEALVGTKRDYIDIFMLHEMESAYTLRGHEKALAYYSKMKAKGYIKALGISTHYVSAAHSAALRDEISVIMAVCNVDGVGVADGTAEDMAEQLDFARSCGKGVVAMKVLGGGNLFGKAETCLDYINSLKSVDTILIGMSSRREIDANCAYFEKNGSFRENFKQLASVQKRLIVESWCTGCGRCEARCSSKAIRVINGKAICDLSKCLRCGYCSKECPEMALKILTESGRI